MFEFEIDKRHTLHGKDAEAAFREFHRSVWVSTHKNTRITLSEVYKGADGEKIWMFKAEYLGEQGKGYEKKEHQEYETKYYDVRQLTGSSYPKYVAA